MISQKNIAKAQDSEAESRIDYLADILGLSKKEIIWTCAIVVVLILVVVLFNVFYDDGSLKIVDGVAQTSGANSLILNTGSAAKPHYYKLGQLAEVDGYTLSAEPVASDENVNT